MKTKQKSTNIVNKETPYQLKVGSLKVIFEYSNNTKTIKECMLNILKAKRG